MFYDVITRTGAIYRLDLERGLWSKYRFWNSDDYAFLEVAPMKIWDMQVGTKLCHPWDGPEFWETAEMPVIGKHLHLFHREVWFTSTEVTHIVEVSSFYPDEAPITNPVDLEGSN